LRLDNDAPIFGDERGEIRLIDGLEEYLIGHDDHSFDDVHNFLVMGFVAFVFRSFDVAADDGEDEIKEEIIKLMTILVILPIVLNCYKGIPI
jgi:hypothetical protein